MRRECREHFPLHRLQRKPLVSDRGMHHGTCVTHMPWCMSGSLTRGDGENVPGIPGACTTRNFTYLARGPWPKTQKAVNCPHPVAFRFVFPFLISEILYRSKVFFRSDKFNIHIWTRETNFIASYRIEAWWFNEEFPLSWAQNIMARKGQTKILYFTKKYCYRKWIYSSFASIK